MPIICASTMAVLHSQPGPAEPVEPGGSAVAATDLSRILRLRVPVVVKLAERRLAMAEVTRLGVGAIIEFAKSSDEPLELLINNKAIAVGEAVKVGENFGLRITQIGDVRQVIRAMGRQGLGGSCELRVASRGL